MQAQFEKALADRGNALSFGLGFSLAEYLGSDEVQLTVLGTPTTGPGEQPRGMANVGALITHKGTLAAPRDDKFAMGWFLGEDLRDAMTKAVGEDKLNDKLNQLATELADQLATDKFTFESSVGMVSWDLWGDYLQGELPDRIGWLHFRVEGFPGGPSALFLAHPWCVLERMFGPADYVPPKATADVPPPTASSEEPMPDFGAPIAPDPYAAAAPPAYGYPAYAPPAPPPVPRASPGYRRLLRTQVPVIVTLAAQDIPAEKLLSIGPGAIIEFERHCEEPLMLSVGNLPIGFGEPVKIGDHFGLKVVSIVSPEERLEHLGGKWKFGS